MHIKKLSLFSYEEEIGSFKYKFRYWFVLLDGEEVLNFNTSKKYFAWSLKKELKESIDFLLGK